MTHILLKNNLKKKILNQTHNKFQIVKRTMLTSKNISRLLLPKVPFKNPNTVLISKRNYPGKGYIGVAENKQQNTSSNIVTAKGQARPLHEETHVVVRDNETGKDVAVLTSAKNLAKGNKFVANENFKGQKNTDGTPKKQFIRTFSEPRYSENVKDLEEVPEATAFLKKYETVVDQHIKTSGVAEKSALKRVHKNSPELFNENGTPIYDEKGNEIDYDT